MSRSSPTYVGGGSGSTSSPGRHSPHTHSVEPGSHKSTHGHGSCDTRPQSHMGTDRSAAEAEQYQKEYDGLLVATKAPPKKNCCTWKVAAVFLVFVAVGLILTWQLLPAEDIVVKYLPQFEEPKSPYVGPEAGDSSSGGTGSEGNDGDIAIGMPPSQTPAGEDDAEGGVNAAGTVVPTFMQCPEGDELCCNGSTLNCKLRVDEMMFGLVHNAMSTEDEGFFIGYNHNLGFEKALISGYRGIGLDVCNCGGELQFCHNVCDYGERYPDDVFTNTLKFLDDYKSEVVVLVFEASTGPIVWNDLYAEMGNVDGFVDMIYVHTYGEEWPTMGDLVTQGKRIIIFYYNGGTCTDEECPDGFHYFYNYAAETQFESASLEDLENVGYSCEITRTTQADALPPDFFVVNNFVTPPDPEAAKVANSKGFLSSRMTDCANENNMRPNFVYLDFWSHGVTAQLVQYANQQYAQQLDR